MKIEEQLGQYLIENNLTIATAESCTGGLVSSKLTDISGSSAYVKLNFVTYANEAKHDILGVDWEILDKFGAVSEECAQSMANGLHKITNCDLALCTTGIAGPTGGTKEKPVGLVYISVKYNNIVTIKEIKLSPNIQRAQMKEEFANQALKLAYETLTSDRI
ncbi:CinA family protein [bacterium]|nr:CinA family protein [bacterium]